MKTFYLFVLVCIFSSVKLFSQTIPAAQLIPYKQDFAGFSSSSSTYPAGWQGWQLSTSGSSNAFRLTAPVGDLALISSATAATTTPGVLNFNEKLGILPSGSPTVTLVDPALCLAVNTTGKVNILVTFDISTIRNVFSATFRRNNIELQYRVGGLTGSFTSLTGSIYRNGSVSQTSGTNSQTGKRYQYLLPVACENQSIIQLRWVQRDSSGTATERSSFAIDNVIVCPAPIVSATVKSACGGNNGAITLSVSAGTTPYSFSWDNINITNGPSFAVTAITKNSTHPYFGQGPTGFGYALDGIQGKELFLTRGIDYTFMGTFPGHPFHITTNATGGTGINTGMVQSGTTNNLFNPSSPTSDGPLVFTPNASHTTLPLYYQCNVHTFMGWRINLNNGGLTTQNISNLAPGKYAAAVFSADGSITTILVTVLTGTTPVAATGSNSPLCTGSSLNLLGDGGVSYSWSGPAFSSNQRNPVINPVTPSNQGSYSLTVTASNGCTSTTFTNVVVLVKPAIFSFTPETGPPGTMVTLNGDNLTDINQVSLGVLTSTPTIINDEQLQFNVPASSTSNLIKVNNTSAFGCRDTSDTPFTVLTILNLTCFLQGLYNTSSGQMTATNGVDADTIIINLFTDQDLLTPAFSDKRVIDINGIGHFYFPEAVIGQNYYIVVKHRNSIETWSKSLVLFGNTTEFDFSQ